MSKTLNNRSQSLARIVITAFSALFIQITIVPFIPGIPSLDLFAAFLVASTFSERFSRLLAITVIGALFIDIFSSITPFGISVIVYGGVILCSHMAGKIFHVRSFSIPSTIITTSAITVLYVTHRLFIAESAINIPSIIGTIIVGLIATAILLRS